MYKMEAFIIQKYSFFQENMHNNFISLLGLQVT